MQKHDAEFLFDTEILPGVKRASEMDGSKDYAARKMAWNNFVDGLQKEGQITERQADTWAQPRSCYSTKEWARDRTRRKR